MSYQWQSDRPLPAGTRVEVGAGRLSIATPGGLIFQAVLSPTERETELERWVAERDERIAWLEDEIDELEADCRR